MISLRVTMQSAGTIDGIDALRHQQYIRPEQIYTQIGKRFKNVTIDQGLQIKAAHLNDLAAVLQYQDML